MANYHSDPTANAAIGTVDKEFKTMRKIAERLKALRKSGRLTPEAEARARSQFTGIFSHILENALAEADIEALLETMEDSAAE